jgi:hypothetical protein
MRKEGHTMNLLLLVILLMLAVGLFHGTDWSRQHGRRIGATVTGMYELIQPIVPLPEGQNLGWRIEAQWTDPQTQKTYKFKGPAVHQFTHYKVGDDIYVFIDPNKIKHYHLEVD